MEYVAGVPIDDYCNTRQLDVRARVELFLRVCDAVQYAHQRLVIHRDVTARNILVTGDGIPKLLDFGIAKLLDADHATAESTRTMFRVMTPETSSGRRPTAGGFR
jgi:eukaryotic-like serine/threonine-protein kinase